MVLIGGFISHVCPQTHLSADFAPSPLRPIATSPHCHFAPLPLSQVHCAKSRESCCRVQRLKITPTFFFKNRDLFVWHKKLCYGTKLAKINFLNTYGMMRAEVTNEKCCGLGAQRSGGLSFQNGCLQSWESQSSL